MDEMENMEQDNVVVLCDEEGNEFEFEMIDTVEYQDGEYAMLLPTDEDAEEIVILQIVTDPDDEEMIDFVTIEDEAVIEAVYSIFKDRLQDEFDFA